ncbi:MAG: hypothetical protein KF752_12475 [Pirellulaceae bacterium]|nr:hypothetical protein [Pirellulaceae bacterium]
MNPTSLQQPSVGLMTGTAPQYVDGNTSRQPTIRTGLSSFPNRLAMELTQFNKVAQGIRQGLQPASDFGARCQQAFEVANDLFVHAPTWVCFYRELMGGSGLINVLFADANDFGRFLRSDQYHQIQLMLTALRSRDLPENDPNDPQRMITVRLPKSLHEAMCEEAGRLNISVNRLCISRMLQLLDPKMIPEIQSKPRGRKPRTRSSNEARQDEATMTCSTMPQTPPATQATHMPQTAQLS